MFYSINVDLLVKEVLVNETDERIAPIEGELAEISIPREMLSGLRGNERVRMASFLFKNMSGLLPESLKEDENNRLVYCKWQDGGEKSEKDIKIQAAPYTHNIVLIRRYAATCLILSLSSYSMGMCVLHSILYYLNPSPCTLCAYHNGKVHATI